MIDTIMKRLKNETNTGATKLKMDELPEVNEGTEGR